MSQETYIRINSDNTIQKVQQTVEDLELNDYFVQEISSQLVRRVRRPAPNPMGVSENWLSVGREESCWCFKLIELPLFAPWRLAPNSENIELDFTQDHTRTLIYWTVPCGMNLVFAFWCGANGDNKRFLVAFSEDQKAWLLPLPNLFEDGSICHGEPPIRAIDLQNKALESWKVFQSSPWNTDLYRNSEAEKMHKMFRVFPEGDQFRTLPPDCGAWTDLCIKITSPIITQYIQP